MGISEAQYNRILEHYNRIRTENRHIQNLSTALATELANAKAIDVLNQAIIKLNFIKGI